MAKIGCNTKWINFITLFFFSFGSLLWFSSCKARKPRSQLTRNTKTVDIRKEVSKNDLESLKLGEVTTLEDPQALDQDTLDQCEFIKISDSTVISDLGFSSFPKGADGSITLCKLEQGLGLKGWDTVRNLLDEGKILPRSPDLPPALRNLDEVSDKLLKVEVPSPVDSSPAVLNRASAPSIKAKVRESFSRGVIFSGKVAAVVSLGGVGVGAGVGVYYLALSLDGNETSDEAASEG